MSARAALSAAPRQAASSTHRTPALTVRPPVHDVLRSDGRPLDADVRAEMEARFGHDFSRVRVHADRRAADSARQVAAHAYTVGEHVVFGEGRYAPRTGGGLELLNHELAHVAVVPSASRDLIQRQGLTEQEIVERIQEIEEELMTSSVPPEREAQLEEELGQLRDDLAALGSEAPGTPVPAAPTPAVKGVGDYLTDIAALRKELGKGSFNAKVVVDRLELTLKGLDLSKPDNLRKVAAAVAGLFPDDPDVLFGLLERLEKGQPKRGKMIRGATLPGQLAPRGPYGTPYGVAAPILAEMAGRPIEEVLAKVEATFKALGYGAASGVVFVSALYVGFSSAVDSKAAAQLEQRLIESPLLPIVFPPIFLAGTVAGIAEEVASLPGDIVDLIGNSRELLTAAASIAEALFSPAGPEVAEAIGLEIGRSFAGDINKAMSGTAFEFAYEIGKLIGPAFLSAVLTFLGIPALAAGKVAVRLAELLRKFAKSFPKLGKYAAKLAAKLDRPQLPATAGDGRPPDSPSGPRADVTPAPPVTTTPAPPSTPPTPTPPTPKTKAEFKKEVKEKLKTKTTSREEFRKSKTMQAAKKTLEKNAGPGNTNAEVQKLLKRVWDAAQSPGARADVAADVMDMTRPGGIDPDVLTMQLRMRAGGVEVTPESAAVLVLAEREGLALMKVLRPLEADEFYEQVVKVPKAFYDVGGKEFAPTGDPTLKHGAITHLFDEITITRGLQSSGLRDMTSPKFRELLGQTEGIIDGIPVGDYIWREVYDVFRISEMRINEPEVLLYVLKSIEELKGLE